MVTGYGMVATPFLEGRCRPRISEGDQSWDASEVTLYGALWAFSACQKRGRIELLTPQR